MGKQELVVTKTGMSTGEGVFWFFAVLLTAGFAYPAYRARRHAANRTSKTYAA